jgi:hypothetical protein
MSANRPAMVCPWRLFEAKFTGADANQLLA